MTATPAGQTLLPSNPRRLGVMLKSVYGNTDSVFFNFLDGTTATTARCMPLDPSGMIFMGTFFPSTMVPEWQGPITMIAASGNQDIRFVEF